MNISVAVSLKFQRVFLVRNDTVTECGGDASIVLWFGRVQTRETLNDTPRRSKIVSAKKLDIFHASSTFCFKTQAMVRGGRDFSISSE